MSIPVTFYMWLHAQVAEQYFNIIDNIQKVNKSVIQEIVEDIGVSQRLI